MHAYMYILECSDNSYYIGSTSNLKLRIEEHCAGQGANYTKNRLPVKLVYFEECKNIKDAFLREKQVKEWSRKKREALIQGKFENLIALSHGKTRDKTLSPSATFLSASSR